MLANRDAFRAFVRARPTAKSGVMDVMGVMPNEHKDLEHHTPQDTRVMGVIELAPNSLEPFDVDERLAMAEIEGGVPSLYSSEFACLQLTCPAGLGSEAWAQAVNDAGLFLDAFGRQAQTLGWNAVDLFGPGGLILSLRGARVNKLTAQQAQLADRRVVARQGNPI